MVGGSCFISQLTPKGNWFHDRSNQGIIITDVRVSYPGRVHGSLFLLTMDWAGNLFWLAVKKSIGLPRSISGLCLEIYFQSSKRWAKFSYWPKKEEYELYPIWVPNDPINLCNTCLSFNPPSVALLPNPELAVICN